jgi:Holliday junction resolvase-like predicted endonuclease
LVAPGIAKRFNELGFHFADIADGNYKILDEKGAIRAEIDLLLENGETIIAVEVKTEPAEKDIPHHIRRLEILWADKDAQHDRRKILGGIAGAIFPKEVKELTQEAGLYVLEQSDDTIQLDVPDDFTPHTW